MIILKYKLQYNEISFFAGDAFGDELNGAKNLQHEFRVIGDSATYAARYDLAIDLASNIAMLHYRYDPPNSIEHGEMEISFVDPHRTQVKRLRWRGEVRKRFQDVSFTQLLEGNEAEIDQTEILGDSTLTPTEKTQLINARVGQGRFRADLEQHWNGRCAVTGCAILATLRASHIKPWRDSSNAERLNKANGLLLVAHLDALFDRGIISFLDNGEMLIKQTVDTEQRQLLGIQIPLRIRKQLTQEQRSFLKHHRKKYCFDLHAQSAPIRQPERKED